MTCTPGRRRLVAALLLGLVLPLLGPLDAGTVGTATAATVDDDPLHVTIAGVSPTRLAQGSTVTLRGTVTNPGDEDWTAAQAYLVIAKTPLTSRDGLDEAVRGTGSYTGTRVVDLDSIDEIGTVGAGETRPFSVRVPWSRLGLSGEPGVYPVGVQVLATDASGKRDDGAVGRATTFLPLAGRTIARVPTSIAWTFRLDDQRGPDGRWSDPIGLLASVSPGGRLDDVLEQASATSGRSTVLLDPALLDAVDDLAAGRRLPADVELSETQRAAAARFRDGLVRLARSTSCWSMGYDRPDLLALARAGVPGTQLSRLVDTTSQEVLSELGVTGCTTVAWPSDSGTDAGLVSAVHAASSTRPLLVTPDDVGDWSAGDGSSVRLAVGDVAVQPAVVDERALDVVPGGYSAATLRQWLASTSLLAARDRDASPDARSDAVVIVPAAWGPGDGASPTAVADVFDLPWVEPTTVQGVAAGSSSSTFDPPRRARAKPIAQALVRDAHLLMRRTANVQKALADPQDRAVGPTEVASSVGLRWRGDSGDGIATTDGALQRSRDQLSDITVDGPPTVTFSGTSGPFPITVRNDNEHAVRLGVRLTSSSGGVATDDLDPVVIGAGERHTFTAAVDVEAQGSTTITARLKIPGDGVFGTPARFNVRSSAVGSTLWIAMGVAGALLVVLVARRIVQRRRATPAPPLPEPTRPEQEDQ